MGTKTMMKDGRFADIFDSPDTIRQAQKDGYHLCTDEELKAREALRQADGKKQSDENPVDTPIDSAGSPAFDLSAMDKKDLLKFAGQRKIYDQSLKALEKEALVKKILETVRAKVAEAGLKTAEEAAAMPESELLALFDSIGKQN